MAVARPIIGGAVASASAASSTVGLCASPPIGARWHVRQSRGIPRRPGPVVKPASASPPPPRLLRRWRAGGLPEEERYEFRLHRGFWCPQRLRGRDGGIVEEANDWYFAMLRDQQRTEFYEQALRGLVEGKRVIDVGAGCGLLALLAARLGAASVLAVEASREMAALASQNAERNGFADRIRVLNAHSTELELPEAEKAEVIVSETFGTLMLGEGALITLADAQRRLAVSGAPVVPSRGTQHAVLVSSPTLASLSSSPAPDSCLGLDLTAADALRDTASIYFTKDRGVRLCELGDLVEVSKRVDVFDVEFGKTTPQDLPVAFDLSVEALSSGVVDAIVTSWELRNGEGNRLRLSTHYEDTRGHSWGLFRDMQWGQGIQLIEDRALAPRRPKRGPRSAEGGRIASSATPPAPFKVEAGEALRLGVRLSHGNRSAMQLGLERSARSDGPGIGSSS